MAHDRLHRTPRGCSRSLRGLAAALVGTAVLSWSPITQAADQRSGFDLLGLQVFAKQTIRAERSDYEGPAAAGGSIDLHDFEVDGDVTAGQHLAFAHGQVRGLVRSPDAQLSDVFSSGRRALTDQSLEMAALKLDLLSARLSALPATSTVHIVKALDGTTEVGARAEGDLGVVDVTGAMLTAAGEDRTRLILTGDGRSQFVVRVHGRSIKMRHLGFALQGGLEPARVVFLFPDADDLEIVFSGGARSAAGEDWNWPGSVLAPNALLRFAASTITGQVFARAIETIPGLPSGQVDRFPPSIEGGFTPSKVLLSIDGDRFVELLREDRSAWQPRESHMPGVCRVVCPFSANATP